MTLQAEFEQAAEELITQVFGPSEVPDLNKPAVFKTASQTGYRNSAPDIEQNITYCLRSDYTEEEFQNNDIRVGDLRFYTLQREFTSVPLADRTKFDWGGITYQVISVVILGSAAYEIQARIS